ncbi:MAG: hypothetical protein IJT21_09695 [Synergistaceae bacterium]|nr:hypothetical protein [Synergistaceae bacterium]
MSNIPRENILRERMSRVKEVKNFRLEQLDKDYFVIQVLPEPDSEVRGIKGSVLDALVDVYGIKAYYEINII